MLCLAMHALTFLVCEWSVEWKKLLTTVIEPDPFQANCIMIVPIAHSGAGAMCDIHRQDHTLFFFFQK
jgi:cation-transporting ATPase 13A1